ncbi:uncharacterized protein SAZU_5244 [Streptomyces azureus]|uniref:Uncharacterized protein n=1 Tax=Streptomyces azureus TaxID=146537 RepID=A0A0K8PRA5_STRAJ|nr:uncharacterized protein SAZU_5244 [Streptomyces azureus]
MGVAEGAGPVAAARQVRAPLGHRAGALDGDVTAAPRGWSGAATGPAVDVVGQGRRSHVEAAQAAAGGEPGPAAADDHHLRVPDGRHEVRTMPAGTAQPVAPHWAPLCSPACQLSRGAAVSCRLALNFRRQASET